MRLPSLKFLKLGYAYIPDGLPNVANFQPLQQSKSLISLELDTCCISPDTLTSLVNLSLPLKRLFLKLDINYELVDLASMGALTGGCLGDYVKAIHSQGDSLRELIFDFEPTMAYLLDIKETILSHIEHQLYPFQHLRVLDLGGSPPDEGYLTVPYTVKYLPRSLECLIIYAKVGVWQSKRFDMRSTSDTISSLVQEKARSDGIKRLSQLVMRETWGHVGASFAARFWREEGEEGTPLPRHCLIDMYKMGISLHRQIRFACSSNKGLWPQDQYLDRDPFVTSSLWSELERQFERHSDEECCNNLDWW